MPSRSSKSRLQRRPRACRRWLRAATRRDLSAAVSIFSLEPPDADAACWLAQFHLGGVTSRVKDGEPSCAATGRVKQRISAYHVAMVRDILELASSLGFLDEISEGFGQQPDSIDPSWQPLLTTAARLATVTATASQLPPPPGPPRPRHPPVMARATATPPTATGAGRPAEPGSGRQLHASRHRHDVSDRRPGHPTVGRWSTPTAAAATSRQARIRSVCSRPPASSSSTRPTWGFTQRDLDRVLEPTGVHGMPRAKLAEILAHLRRVYADTVGSSTCTSPRPHGGRGWPSGWRPSCARRCPPRPGPARCRS